MQGHMRAVFVVAGLVVAQDTEQVWQVPDEGTVVHHLAERKTDHDLTCTDEVFGNHNAGAHRPAIRCSP